LKHVSRTYYKCNFIFASHKIFYVTVQSFVDHVRFIRVLQVQLAILEVHTIAGSKNISFFLPTNLPTILPSSKIVERAGKQERGKNRTKSLNWLRFSEFGRGIERTSFALLTFQPCRTKLNVFANMYVSPMRSMPGSYSVSPFLPTISLVSSCSLRACTLLPSGNPRVSNE